MKNPPAGWPRIVPAVFYDDAAAAIDWLTRAFGFVVRERVEDDRGRIVHSQLVLNGGVIMVGQAGLSPERAYARSPRAADGANTQGLAVFVDDADAHCERARGRRRHHDGAGDSGLRRGLLGGSILRGGGPRGSSLVVFMQRLRG